MAFIMDKTILILNPSASRGTAIFQKDKIESALRENKIKSDLYITKSSEDLGRATENFVKEGYVNFIAAGGDGTVHYMIQKLANTDRNIGTVSYTHLDVYKRQAFFITFKFFSRYSYKFIYFLRLADL